MDKELETQEDFSSTKNSQDEFQKRQKERARQIRKKQYQKAKERKDLLKQEEKDIRKKTKRELLWSKIQPASMLETQNTENNIRG